MYEFTSSEEGTRSAGNLMILYRGQCHGFKRAVPR